MRRVALLLAVVVTVPGCLINSHSEKVVGRDSERVKVEFESPEGMQRFVQAVNVRYPGQRDLGTSSFGIPFIIGASSHKVLSENTFFNAQVERADLNGDGTINDAEASAYAG